MCCFFAVLLTAGPRLAGIIWWLLRPLQWSAAFNGSVIWPILGIIFLPWTTLFFVIVAPGGVTGIDWLWIVLGVVADFASHAGGATRRRDLSYYPESMP